jgi:hypothetical protein
LCGRRLWRFRPCTSKDSSLLSCGASSSLDKPLTSPRLAV